ncbi:hypothetical protein LSH36_363g01009 [Paralvinella palmiformis]|uniref:SH2 domain-containing protein n=1 Tax=Paralvinella palmiformis TaxID=53620 RepID=A0AAD9JFG4_9ANNE|nr:hypothetical protein LSH36_363g01009 [Paralvinella palmiformis]
MHPFPTAGIPVLLQIGTSVTSLSHILQPNATSGRDIQRVLQSNSWPTTYVRDILYVLQPNNIPVGELRMYYSLIIRLLVNATSVGDPHVLQPNVTSVGDLYVLRPNATSVGNLHVLQHNVTSVCDLRVIQSDGITEGELWYFDIDRNQVAEKLQEKEGMFLVRRSRRAGSGSPYTLCIFHSNRVYNLNIRYRQDGMYALGTPHSDEKTFSTVRELIDYHYRSPITLTKPRSEVLLIEHPLGDIYDETSY